jgi:hypothetical protein
VTKSTGEVVGLCGMQEVKVTIAEGQLMGAVWLVSANGKTDIPAAGGTFEQQNETPPKKWQPGQEASSGVAGKVDCQALQPK